MRFPRIFQPVELIQGETCTLSEDASRHVGRVLRLTTQDRIHIFNGQGDACLAEIVASDKRAIKVRLLEALPAKATPALHTHLGQVISRGERMDYAIQKSVELGVSEITPLFSSRCEVKLQADRLQKRLQHWRQVAISACEQCGMNMVPSIHPAMALTQWLAERTEQTKLVLHHRASVGLDTLEPANSVALLIGPEGGLVDEEVDAAEASGFESICLGPRVLRTETAPVVALSLLQYRFGDFS